MTALFSGPYASAGGRSITPDTFERTLVVHSVRRLPKAEWHNDRDQFMRPAEEPLPAEFVNDCVVWSLYANSNNTTALRDVRYAGKTYQVPNHFFPLALSTLRNRRVGDSGIAMQLPTAQDRFVATWLGTHTLSNEAQAVTASAVPVWRMYFDRLNLVRLSKFRIATWDAGWWQARCALADASMAATELASLKLAHDRLKEKLLPQLSQLGFLG